MILNWRGIKCFVEILVLLDLKRHFYQPSNDFAAIFQGNDLKLNGIRFACMWIPSEIKGHSRVKAKTRKVDFRLKNKIDYVCCDRMIITIHTCVSKERKS